MLSDFDGVLTEVYVRHFPIVIGDGSGSTSNTPSSVSATINGNATVIIEVDGAKGKVRLAEAPSQGDDVRISYFFNRTDTLLKMRSCHHRLAIFRQRSEVQPLPLLSLLRLIPSSLLVMVRLKF